jgi:hypothetical protein
MLRPVRLLISLVLILAAAPASAQEAEPLREPHPLREMLTETMRTQQTLALKRMVDAQRALAHARAVAYVDLDQDGEGEFATLPEVLGLVRWRGSRDPPAGVLGWGDAILHDDGVVEAMGYLYRVVLPDASGGPAPGLEDVDPDRSEREAILYAWPVRYGLSGRWTFGSHVTRSALLGVDTAAYSGRDRRPADDALLAPVEEVAGRSGLSVPLAEGGTGRDGEVWEPMRGRAEVLQQEHAAADVEWPSDGAGRAWKELWKALLSVDTTPRPDGVTVTPPVGHAATPREISEAIARDLRHPMERSGQWEWQKASFALVGAVTPMKFVESERRVLICHETLALSLLVTEVPESRWGQVLDLLVVHEMAHSLDFQTFPLTNALNDCADEAAIAAWSAVIEGHAQQMMRRAAAALRLQDALPYALALTAADEAGGAGAPAEARAAMASLSFPYHDGERFMDAVRERWGDEGVAEVLRNPPRRPMLIETPDSFFARGRGAAPTDWPHIMDALIELEGPGADVRRSPVLRRTLVTMLAPAPQLDPRAIVDGILDVESRVAAAPDGRAQTASTVLMCRDADAARAYVIASRALQAAQDRAYEQNPLVDPDVKYAPPPELEGVHVGYRVRKHLRSGGSSVHGLAVSVAAGRWVVEAAVTRLDTPEDDVERSLIRAVESTLKALPD